MYVNTETMQYPLTEKQVKAAFPERSFPKSFVAPEPFAVVFQSPKPEYDPLTQSCVEIMPGTTAKGTWEQRYKVEDLPQDIADANIEAAQAQMKAGLRQQAIDTYNNTLSALEQLYPQREIDTWDQQVIEANAYLADNEASTPLLDAMLTTKPTQTKAGLVDAIVANHMAYSALVGAALGRMQTTLDDIDAM